MNALRATTLLLLAACAARPRPAQAAPPLWVNRSETEFAALLDADGDGDLDAVVADRATGFLRVGRRTGPAALAWETPAPGGVAPLDDLAAGSLMTNARHAVALAGRLANRVALVDLLDAASARAPRPLFPRRAGPGLVAALDTLPGDGTDELFLATDLNGGGASFHRQLFRAGGYGLMSEADASSGSAPFTFAAGIAVSNNALPRVAGLLPADSRIWLFGGGSAGATLGTGPSRAVTLTDQTRFVYGFFNPASALGQFLLYTPGSTAARRLALQSDHVYGVTFSAVGSLTLPAAPALIAPGPAAGELTLIRTSGRASVYAYDGSALTLVNALPPPAGLDGDFTGALADPATGHAFMLFDTDGDGRSDTSCRYAKTGGTYGPADAPTAMTSFAGLQNRPTALAFLGEPLVNPAAARLAAYAVGDWTVSASGVTPDTTVSAAADRGAALGLGAPAATVVSGVPADATHILVGQLAADIAAQPLFTAAGESVSDLLVTPAGGTFDNALEIAITAPASLSRILYRLAPADPWTEHAGTSLSLWLFKDTVLQCFGWNGSNGRTTPIVEAAFAFTRPPEEQDGDGDGVPDFVELQLGLDPAAGQDHDDDGLSDLDELLGGTDPASADSDGDTFTDREERAAGTDPNDPASTPTDEQILAGTVTAFERLAVFDLTLGPRPYDGFSAADTVCATGVAGRVTALDGTLLGTAVTAPHSDPLLPTPALAFAGLPTPFDGLLAGFTTPAHFDVATANPDTRIGRELVKLLVAPPATPVAVAYAWGGGATADEAAAWTNAAAAAYAAAARPAAGDSAGVLDTLTAALFEALAGRELAARGLLATNALSLFPARTEPASLPHPTAAQLLALQTADPGGRPAYSLTNALAWLRGACTNGAFADVTALRDLALALYRHASTEMNGAPGQYPLPLDALREVIRQGTVPGAYTNHISPAAAATARLGADRLLGLVPARARVSLDLLAGGPHRADSAVLADPADGLRYSLVTPAGDAFPIAFAFAVPSNSAVSVDGFLNGPDARRGADFEVEVVSLAVTALPAPSPSDTDGNLLPDAYERLVFGASGASALRDADTDGYSDLQEYLEGSDPSDAASAPGVAPLDLSPPQLHIALAGTDIDVSWLWPSRYQNRFAFLLEATDDLRAAFTEQAHAPTAGPGDRLRVLLPAGSEGPRRFYRVRTSLR